jgi:hypothetical protein
MGRPRRDEARVGPVEFSVLVADVAQGWLRLLASRINPPLSPQNEANAHDFKSNRFNIHAALALAPKQFP